MVRSRDWLTWPAGAGTVWAIGNGPGDTCPTAVEITDDRTELANQISYAREGATTAVRAADPTSQSLYGVLPLERTDLICSTDDQVSVLAHRALQVKAPGGDRVRAATLSAATDPDVIVPLLLAADVTASPPIRARIRVNRDTARYDQTGVLQRVTHSITGGEWVTRLGFDLAAPYVAEVARWGSARWGVDGWSTPVLERIAV